MRSLDLDARSMQEITSSLLLARSLSDVRHHVLPVLRRELGLAALGVRLLHDGTLLSHGEARGAYELPLDVRHNLLGSIVFLPQPPQTGERAAAWLARLAPLIGAAMRNALDFEQLYRSAVTDHVTGLFNRRFFGEALERELAGVRRHGRPLSLLAVDLDRFKEVNDRFGHLAGDAMLRATAEVLRRTTRSCDVAARVGGDEFLVLVGNANQARARVLAERILRRLHTVPTPAPELRLSASIGVASAPPSAAAAELLDAADAAMYGAKRDGRARVAAATLKSCA